jgi:hypothetical protein
MPRIIEFQLTDEEPQLTVRDRELLLEVLDAAIEETLAAATVFDNQTDIRRGYNQRLNTLLTLFQKIMGSGDSEVLPKGLLTPAEYNR